VIVIVNWRMLLLAISADSAPSYAGKRRDFCPLPMSRTSARHPVIGRLLINCQPTVATAVDTSDAAREDPSRRDSRYPISLIFLA
jgi:hypothetical protein